MGGKNQTPTVTGLENLRALVVQKTTLSKEGHGEKLPQAKSDAPLRKRRSQGVNRG
jgi:hypothetical protein